MTNMMRTHARGLTSVAARLWPARPWRYEGGERDLRLDLLRGFAVIAMVADHIGGEHSWLYVMTGGDRFFVSAAEVFVCLSGLVMGLISAGVIARQALGVALLKALRRAWTLYLLTVTLTLMFATFSRQLGLWWAPPVTVATWPDFIISVLTLHRTYFLTDILLLYTLLLLGAVPMLVLLAHGYTRVVLAGSWGLWALWQLVPQHAVFPWPIADNSVFHVPTWQVLFNTALAIGFHRQHLEERLAHVSPRLVLSLSGVFVAGAIAFYRATQPSASLESVPVFKQVFAKVNLSIGRLIVCAGFLTFAFSLLTVAWAPIDRALRWLLLPLGQHALSAYTWHLFVTALIIRMKPAIVGAAPATAAQNTLLQVVAITLIWALIRLQPTALTQFRASVSRVKNLLAVKREHFSLPAHSSDR